MKENVAYDFLETFSQAERFIDHTGRLPEGFSNWTLRSSDGVTTIAHYAASQCALPPDFDQWDLRDISGRTVAHVAARHRAKLPDDFNGWEWSDIDGTTVAHEAGDRCFGRPDFDRWDIVDGDGFSIAHQAALAAFALPEDFDGWHWCCRVAWSGDSGFDSVLDYAITNGLPHRGSRAEYFEAIMNKLGCEKTSKTVLEVIMASENHGLINEVTSWKESKNLKGVLEHKDEAPSLKNRQNTI